jgi:hypothetical protein
MHGHRGIGDPCCTGPVCPGSALAPWGATCSRNPHSQSIIERIQNQAERSKQEVPRVGVFSLFMRRPFHCRVRMHCDILPQRLDYPPSSSAMPRDNARGPCTALAFYLPPSHFLLACTSCLHGVHGPPPLLIMASYVLQCADPLGHAGAPMPCNMHDALIP